MRVRRLELILFLLPLSVGVAASRVGAADVGEQLQDVQRNVEQERARAAELSRRSAAIARELNDLRQSTIQSAKSAQEQESRLAALKQRLDDLTQIEQADLDALHGQHAELAFTLGALERVALFPPEAVAVLPESPVDTLRTAILLRTAVPVIEQRAGRLRADLDELRVMHVKVDAQRQAVAAAQATLTDQRARLSALIERKQALYRDNEVQRTDAEARVAKLTSEAKDMRDLLDRIEAEQRARDAALARSAPPPVPPAENPSGSPTTAPPPGRQQLAALPPLGPRAIRPFDQARGRLTLPARGAIVRNFGESGAYGAVSKGLSIRTLPGAEVVAPYDGQVVFAGPFRGYGQILIIEHSGGYHTLLSGLSRIDAVAGQWVLAGEPVGVMGQPVGGNGPELYVELRHNGRPIDPLPWLASRNGKVNG